MGRCALRGRPGDGPALPGLPVSCSGLSGQWASAEAAGGRLTTSHSGVRLASGSSQAPWGRASQAAFLPKVRLPDFA